MLPNRATMVEMSRMSHIVTILPFFSPPLPPTTTTTDAWPPPPPSSPPVNAHIGATLRQAHQFYQCPTTPPTSPCHCPPILSTMPPTNATSPAPDAARKAPNHATTLPFNTAIDIPHPRHDTAPQWHQQCPSTAMSPPTARPNDNNSVCHVTAESMGRRWWEEWGWRTRQRCERRGKKGREMTTTCLLSSFPTVFIKDQGPERQGVTTYSVVTPWHSWRQQLGRTVHTGRPGECPLTTAIGQDSVKPICCLVSIYFPPGGLPPSPLFGGAFFLQWFCQREAGMYLPLLFPLFTPYLLGFFFFNNGIVDRAWYL